MLFERGPSPAPPVETALTDRRGRRRDARTPWAQVVATGYGLPDDALPWFAAVPALTGWHAFLALDGDEPAAAAAVWIDGARRVLRVRRRRSPSTGARAARARSSPRGSSGRSRRAARRSSPRPASSATGSPSASYRNILRYGFEERFVVAHRLRRRPAPG